MSSRIVVPIILRQIHFAIKLFDMLTDKLNNYFVRKLK